MQAAEIAARSQNVALEPLRLKIGGGIGGVVRPVNPGQVACPPAEREQQIAELEGEIDRLQRTEEAIVVATSAPRERGCPPWVVLGVKAVEARGIRAA